MLKQVIVGITVETADVAAWLISHLAPDEVEIKKEGDAKSVILKWKKEL